MRFIRTHRRALSRIAAVAALTAIAPAPAAHAAQGLPSDWIRGANVTAWWWNAYESPTAAAALASLRATGSTDASFIVTWYMDSGGSSSIAPDARKTPSDASLLAGMRTARSLGMRAILKPHVDVRDGTFRGDIAPASPAEWFAQYRAMIDHYAELAQSAGASLFVVGTELTSMARDEAAFREVIAGARARFSGQLTFAANWVDGARQAKFWDALDYIGIDAYMPLSAADPNPPVESLEAAWRSLRRGGETRRYVDEIGALHAAYGRPVIFTEIGYQSRLGAALTPWDSVGGPALEPQERAYEAAYRVWSGVPWFKGFLWWEWSAEGRNGNVADGSFIPAGKPAAMTMTAWSTAAPAPAPPAAEPGAGPPATGGARPVARRRAALALERRGGALVGTLPAGCRRPLRMRLDRRRGAGWRRVRAARARPDAAGRFRVALGALGRGRYRATARPACRGVAAARVLFRIS